MSTNTNTTEPKKPVAKIRVGSVTASIWENTNDKGTTFRNVTFQRSYKDKDGKWCNADNGYNEEETLQLAKAADLAHTRIIQLRNGE